MIGFLRMYAATALIILFLIGIVTAIIVSIVKNKKKGKSSCGCNCSSCPMSGSCHKE